MRTRNILSLFMLAVLFSSFSNLGGTDNNSFFSQYSNFYQSWYYTQFIDTPVGGGGGSMSVDITDDILTVYFSAGFSQNKLKNGLVASFTTSPNLPDLELGFLKLYNGSNNYYSDVKVSVISNAIVFTHIAGNNSQLYTGVSTTQFQVDLSALGGNNTSLSDENYIHTITYTTGTSDGNVTDDEKIESVTYFDGLGRPMQNVAIRAGGNSEDIVTHIGYDDFGRQDKEWLPYSSNSSIGSYRTDALSATGTFYDTEKYENTTNPYSEQNLEVSPLNRVLEQAAPGNDWALDKLNDTDHTIKFDYLTNVDSDLVRQFGVTFLSGNTEEPQLEDQGFYATSELYKTITKDENWQPNSTYPDQYTSQEFKDKMGRVVLKRAFKKLICHDTYYVYDDYGNLTFVLPPMVNTYASINQQPWIGKSFPSTDVFEAFENHTSQTSIITFTITETGSLTFNWRVTQNQSGFSLNDGYIMDMDFFDPQLPDITLGDILVRDSSGNMVLGGNAYVQAGNLYFSSTGVTETRPRPTYNLTIDLNNYQSSFSVPSLNAVQLDEFAYQYKYDSRNRLIEKKIPGKGWEYIIYDRLDRPILTQDSNLRNENKWLFTKYDAYGRVVYTGIWVDGNAYPRAQLQSEMDSSVLFETKTSTNQNLAQTTIYYTNNASPSFSNDEAEILSINYYDDYENLPTGLGTTTTTYYGLTSTINTKGLATVSKIRVLDTNDWTTTVTYYDSKSSPIYVFIENEYLDTNDIIENQLDFTGKTIQSKTTHKKTGQIDIVTVDNFVYDHIGRLVTQKQDINSQGEGLIVKNHYDELGQLVKKDVGHTESQPLQQVDYAYNVRGWLKSINNPKNLYQDKDLFGFGLNYNTPEFPSTSSNYNVPLYNGNISHTSWQTDNSSSSVRHYNYLYDGLNRLVNAYFGENDASNSKFNESINNYDRLGNIQNLTRYSINTESPYQNVAGDQLYYYYQGNQLLRVDDISSYGDQGGFIDGNTVGDDYAYDDNGNMVRDLNKGIGTSTTNGITYNHLNLPVSVTIDDGASNVGTISYIYDATGTKLSKTVNPGNTTYYAGNYVYEGSSLKFISQPEGYIEPKNENDLSQGFDYIYQYKDHLGNIRLSYSDNNDDGIITGGSEQVFFDGFESASGWDGSGNTWGWDVDEFDSDFKFDGNYSARLDPHPAVHHENVAHSNDWVIINNTEATDYIYSCWVFLENVPGNQADLFLFMKEDGETGYYTLVEQILTQYTKGQWIYLEERVTVPPNITKLNIRLDNNYSGSVWFDNVSIRKANDVNDIEILEENNYYPFGLKHKGYNYNIGSTNIALKNKFQGQELEDELGKNTYAFEWRDYDPAIGRFNKIDRFAEKYVDASPYGFTANNPIALREIKGDSIQVYFYDKEGNRTNNIPKAGQKMFNEEFGIKVGYNSDTSMLYYEGDFDSNLSQSESATEGLVSALKDDNTGEDARKHGVIEFGYNLKDPKTGQRITGGAYTRNYSGGGTTMIDLEDFGSNGNHAFIEFNAGLNPRVFNMARVFEHEYFGHGSINRGIGADGGMYSMGRAVETTNVFRRERGLDERLHYGWGTNVIYFGNTSSYNSKGEQRRAVRNMVNNPLSNQLFMTIQIRRKN